MKNSLKSNSSTCPVKSQISHLSQAGINLFYLVGFNKMNSLSKMNVVELKAMIINKNEE